MSEKDVGAELAALKARVAELEARAKPPAPPKFEGGVSGPTTTQLAINRVSMSAEVMRDMANAVPAALVRELVGDGGATATLKPLAADATRRRVADENRSGWRAAQPLTNPPGVSLADKIMDAADRADQVQLANG
jgi:hypothetical protein